MTGSLSHFLAFLGLLVPLTRLYALHDFWRVECSYEFRQCIESSTGRKRKAMSAYHAINETQGERFSSFHQKHSQIPGQAATWSKARELGRIAEEYIDKLMAERKEQANG
jgi:hypothetical protein